MVSEHQPALPILLTLFIALQLASSSLAADEVSDDTSAELPARVQHILQTKCSSCHNGVDRKGDFSLQSQKSLADSGFVVPNHSSESHFISVVTADAGQPPSMPQNGEPLTKDEVHVLKSWIDDGAPWPQNLVLTEPVIDNFNWWSLQPIVRPTLPAINAGTIDGTLQTRTPIDHFIAAKQLELGLTPADEADRRTLIRRLTYDLTGLPPTIERMEAFLTDTAPDAYERLVEELLASPNYGEHWARHWLDVVKYADTCGFDKDKLRPNAWPYRDYVIRSFNDDKPYARFVK